MLKKWLNRRQTRAVANDAAKLIPHVLGRYAELMEKHGGTYMDESWLPLDKPGMKMLLELAIVGAAQDEKRQEWLKAGWLLLALFQPCIGQTPLAMPELPENFEDAKRPEFMEAFKQWSEIQDRVSTEMESNKREMDEFLSSL